ncbi:acyltransferase [Paenibacillus mucilaginosus]|uniref:Acetyltransferase n=1 Tax=Paenibacillus mucilaginosus (strain KNP414) TaxID=1036673 RepID=F8F7P5_PAEMK|nr:DapH/DapD/GlmU-related protein [Paenibacillus mucilaginosus]AEI39530.1 hypothetical protein KNP414_00940 [Paenibacillus mucilaginosus KNP414]WDM28489.1 acyltransferase [Paenibacillus mucilaginosus]
MIGKMKELLKKARGEISTEQLIKMGLTVGKNFNRRPGCIIDYSHCFLITIGDDVTFAPRVHILAHDASTKVHLNYTKIGLVEIGDRVFIGAGAIVLPNVKIGNDAIIGAGAVVTKDVPAGSIVAGSPARVVGNTAEYIEKNKELMTLSPVYDHTWTVSHGITPEQKRKMKEDLRNKIGFIE